MGCSHISLMCESNVQVKGSSNICKNALTVSFTCLLVIMLLICILLPVHKAVCPLGQVWRGHCVESCCQAFLKQTAWLLWLLCHACSFVSLSSNFYFICSSCRLVQLSFYGNKCGRIGVTPPALIFPGLYSSLALCPTVLFSLVWHYTR